MMMKMIFSILFVVVVCGKGSGTSHDSGSLWAVTLQDGIDPTAFASLRPGLKWTGVQMFGVYIFNDTTRRRARMVNEYVVEAELISKRSQFTRSLFRVNKQDSLFNDKSDSLFNNKRDSFFKNKRDSDGDPLYSQQWHLQRVESHLFNGTGRGIVIAIVDDGLQHVHPEIRRNYDAAHSYDFNGDDADPSPSEKNL